MKKFEVTTYKFSYTIEAETFEAARAEMDTFADGYKGMFNVQPPTTTPSRTPTATPSPTAAFSSGSSANPEPGNRLFFLRKFNILNLC